MMRDRRIVPYVVILLSLLIFMCGSTVVRGQGGTGKLPPQRMPNPPRKMPPPRNNLPAFRPKNPGIELVKISPGSFMMGSSEGDPDEKPIHQVTINYSFYMGKYEVTQAQWKAVMGDNPSSFKDCGGNCPVERVSWDDAQKFIQRLNQTNDGYSYRLPTEAEWEYACRAGTTGDYAGNLNEMAWYSTNSENKTHAAGAKQPNPWGLFDMHGNVWEWCLDFFHDTYEGAPTDGSAWLGRDQNWRVLRGGSWLSNAPRSAGRNVTPDNYRGRHDSSAGFRVVAVLRSQ